MPLHNYHLKFELYPSSDPACRRSPASPPSESVWIPSETSSIFDDLPSHPRRHKPTTRSHPAPKSLQHPALDDRTLPRVLDLSNPAGADEGRPLPHPPADPAADDDHDDQGSNNLVLLTERQWRARKESFPAPGFAVGLGPRTAVRDWRFGRLSVESFDIMASSHNSRIEQGQGQGQGNAALPAAGLGPTFGGPGQSTKARYVPLETKNTEVGWGIVHLYRESVDGGSPSSGGGGGSAAGEGQGEGRGSSEVGDGDGQDGTILCIPAVPSYLSPSDFLGFVGEKWRGDVSHYRMVMTGRMNRYMVLMKFRDKWRAQDWRKEFDGRVFNSMEVRASTLLCTGFLRRRIANEEVGGGGL